jgi:hypothetical protein
MMFLNGFYLWYINNLWESIIGEISNNKLLNKTKELILKKEWVKSLLLK